MGKASSAKKVARAARAGGNRRTSPAATPAEFVGLRRCWCRAAWRHAALPSHDPELAQRDFRAA